MSLSNFFNATLVKEKIQKVFGYNEETDEVDVFTVTHYHVHDDPITIDLTVDFDLTDDIPGELIETTPEHPFYVLGEWVDAEDLEVGMPLSTYEGIDLVYSGTVTSVERVEETQTMYNLTVDTAHTFFVGEGKWLVHNTSCSWIDDLIDSRGRKVRGNFPDNAGSGEVLYRTDSAGNVTYYATYDSQGRIVSRADITLTSKPHNGVPPPHIEFYHYENHTNPLTGDEFIKRVTSTGDKPLNPLPDGMTPDQLR